MIKKFSIFFKPRLIKQLTLTPELEKSGGFQWISQLPLKVLEVQVKIPRVILNDQVAEELAGVFRRYVDGRHSESDSLNNWFKVAHRIECVIGLLEVSEAYAIELDINFYKRAEKSFFTQMHIMMHARDRQRVINYWAGLPPN
jgi:hypothetical protein